MLRNRKYTIKKEIKRTLEQLHEIQRQMRNQSLVPLDKPYHRGYWVSYKLRSDILRSKDGETLSYILKNYTKPQFSIRKDRKVKYKSTKVQYIFPEFIKLSERKFNELPENHKKYFVKLTSSTRVPYYYWVFSIQEWKLEITMKKHYVTHYKEHDEILYQIEDELTKKLYSLSSNPWGYGNSYRYEDKTLMLEKEDRKVKEELKVFMKHF